VIFNKTHHHAIIILRFSTRHIIAIMIHVGKNISETYSRRIGQGVL